MRKAEKASSTVENPAPEGESLYLFVTGFHLREWALTTFAIIAQTTLARCLHAVQLAPVTTLPGNVKTLVTWGRRGRVLRTVKGPTNILGANHPTPAPTCKTASTSGHHDHDYDRPLFSGTHQCVIDKRSVSISFRSLHSIMPVRLVVLYITVNLHNLSHITLPRLCRR